ncbi:hypothetical protein QBC36DRAFT_358988, partial [Triangularia setosa]
EHPTRTKYVNSLAPNFNIFFPIHPLSNSHLQFWANQHLSLQYLAAVLFNMDFQPGTRAVPQPDIAGTLENSMAPPQTTTPAGQPDTTVIPSANVVPSCHQDTTVLPSGTVETAQQNTATGAQPDAPATHTEGIMPHPGIVAVQSGCTVAQQDRDSAAQFFAQMSIPGFHQEKPASFRSDGPIPFRVDGIDYTVPSVSVEADAATWSAAKSDAVQFVMLLRLVLDAHRALEDARTRPAAAADNDRLRAVPKDRHEEKGEASRPSSLYVTAPKTVDPASNPTPPTRQEVKDLRPPAECGLWKIHEEPCPYFGPLAPNKPKLIVLLMTGRTTVAALHSSHVGSNIHVDRLLDTVMAVKVGSTTILSIRASVVTAPEQVERIVSVPTSRVNADHLLQHQEILPFLTAATGVDIGAMKSHNADIQQLCSWLWQAEPSPRFEDRRRIVAVTAPSLDQILPQVFRILFHPGANRSLFRKFELGF